jgi:hypothetical protein
MCKPYVKQVLNTTLPQLLQYAVFGKPSEAISAALDALVLEILEFCWCCTVSNPQLLFVAAEVESPMNHNDHQPIRLSDHSHSIVKSNIYPALILAATKTSDRTVVSRGLVRLH